MDIDKVEEKQETKEATTTNDDEPLQGFVTDYRDNECKFWIECGIIKGLQNCDANKLDKIFDKQTELLSNNMSMDSNDDNETKIAKESLLSKYVVLFNINPMMESCDIVELIHECNEIPVQIRYYPSFYGRAWIKLSSHKSALNIVKEFNKKVIHDRTILAGLTQFLPHYVNIQKSFETLKTLKMNKLTKKEKLIWGLHKKRKYLMRKLNNQNNWICKYCEFSNFSYRTICLKCGKKKSVKIK